MLSAHALIDSIPLLFGAFPEEHHGRVSVLKYLSDINVFWKGMSLDLDAFIHGCPECVCKNPLRSSASIRIPSQSAVLTAQEREEEEPHLSEVKGQRQYDLASNMCILRYLVCHLHDR